jgi:hypothetical protein
MTKTFLSAWASAKARFKAVLVFPSFSTELVTTTDLISFSITEKNKLVLRVLKASAYLELDGKLTNRLFLSFSAVLFLELLKNKGLLH